jgi:hypothetical protein
MVIVGIMVCFHSTVTDFARFLKQAREKVTDLFLQCGNRSVTFFSGLRWSDPGPRRRVSSGLRR